jgi:hypothetical protein
MEQHEDSIRTWLQISGTPVNQWSKTPRAVAIAFNTGICSGV